MIELDDLVAGQAYWARRKAAADEPEEIVRVSTVFGDAREYWSVATFGDRPTRLAGRVDVPGKDRTSRLTKRSFAEYYLADEHLGPLSSASRIDYRASSRVAISRSLIVVKT